MSRTGLLSAVGCALILCCSASAGAAVADNCLDPGLVNGSAEDTLAAMSGVGGAAPAGWTVTGGLTSRHYAAPGSLHDPPGNSWGVRYFEGGDSPLATATQTLPVRPGCEDTYDVPFFWFLISAHLGAVEGEPDAARVELRFLDSGGTGHTHRCGTDRRLAGCVPGPVGLISAGYARRRQLSIPERIRLHRTEIA